MKTLQSTIIPSNVGIIYPLSRHIIHQDIFSRIVGMIYPIPTKASNCVKCPKLFDFISIRISKCLFSIPAPEGRTETVQLTFIPQELAWYIQYQPISSTVKIVPNCWLWISNIYFFKNVHFTTTRPKVAKKLPNLHSSTKIYPIQTCIYTWYVFPKQLAAHIQYKFVFPSSLNCMHNLYSLYVACMSPVCPLYAPLPKQYIAYISPFTTYIYPLHIAHKTPIITLFILFLFCTSLFQVLVPTA